MNKAIKTYGLGVLILTVMIFFRFIPAPDPITPIGMTVIGIFLGCVIGWCSGYLIWPSLLGLIVLAFTGLKSGTEIWQFIMSQPALVNGFWLMVACGILVNSGLADYIANWSITRKFTEGKPWLFISILYWGVIAVAAIIGSIGAVLVFWAIIYSITQKLGWKKGDKEPAWMIFSIVIFAITGCFLFPYQMVVITNFGFLAAGSNGAFNGSFSYGAYLIFAVINQILLFTVFMLASKFIFRINLSKLAEYKVDMDKKITLNKAQKIGLVLFVLMFILLMAPSFVPKSTVPFAIISMLDTTATCFLVTMLACLIMSDGKPLTTFKELVYRNVSWEVLIMFGTALMLASIINSEESGVIVYITQLIGPVLGSMAPFTFVMLLMLITMVMTNLINNVVVSAIIMPMCWGLCSQFDINPLAVAALFTAFVDYAIILPSSSPIGALLYGNSDWIKPKDIIFWGAISFTLFYIVSVFIGYPLSDMLFRLF